MLKHIFLRLTPVFDSVRFNKFPCDVGRTGSGRALWGPLSYCGLPFPITQSFLIKFPFNKLQLHSNLIPRKVDLGYLDWSFGASQTFPREWITSLGLTKKWNFIYTFLRGCSVNCLITCLHGRQGKHWLTASSQGQGFVLNKVSTEKCRLTFFFYSAVFQPLASTHYSCK